MIDQTENQSETMDSCFELVGSRQHGVAARTRLINKWSTK